MKTIIKIVSVLIYLMIFKNILAQDTYYLKQELTNKIVSEANKKDDKIYIEEFYFNVDFLVFNSPGKRIVINNKAQNILFVDKKNKTYLKTSLPFNPLNILTEVSSLRFIEDSKAKGMFEKSGSGKQISGISCNKYLLSLNTRYPEAITLWTTSGITITGKIKNLLKQFWTIEHYNCNEAVIANILSMNGFVLEYELIQKRRNETRITKAVCIEFSKKEFPHDLLAVSDEYSLKEKITYTDLIDGTLGEKPKIYNSDEIAVLDVIEKFRDGYRKKDLDYIDQWVEALFAEDAFILGTDAPWPDTWEWQGGHKAAKEMFARDWRRWGDVKIFDDEIFINVDGNAAWVVAFATVTRSGNDDNKSRQRSLARIAEYSKEESWTSRRVLYEIIADASNVLAQYERGDDFITPMRTEFGLIKLDGKWLLKMIHFSHPARGFRSFRLFRSDIKLSK